MELKWDSLHIEKNCYPFLGQDDYIIRLNISGCSLQCDGCPYCSLDSNTFQTSASDLLTMIAAASQSCSSMFISGGEFLIQEFALPLLHALEVVPRLRRVVLGTNGFLVDMSLLPTKTKLLWDIKCPSSACFDEVTVQTNLGYIVPGDIVQFRVWDSRDAMFAEMIASGIIANRQDVQIILRNCNPDDRQLHKHLKIMERLCHSRIAVVANNVDSQCMYEGDSTYGLRQLFGTV